MFLKFAWRIIPRAHGEAYRRRPEIFFTGASPMFRHVLAGRNAFLPFHKILAVVYLTCARYSSTDPAGPFGPVMSALPCRNEAPAAFFIILLIFALRMLRLSSVILRQTGYLT